MTEPRINGWGEWGKHVLKTLDELNLEIADKVCNNICEERMARLEELAKDAKKAAEKTMSLVVLNILVVIAIGIFMHNF